MVPKLGLAVSFLLCTSAAFADRQAEQVEQMLRLKMSQFQIPGLQYAVIRHKDVVAKGALGLANIQEQVPVTMRTVLPINSITKAFVGVALMQLVEAGKLNLDAPVSRYLDGLPEAWRAIPLRMLASHISGIPDIWDENSSLIEGTPQEAWKKVLASPMEFAPGSKFKYNQTNYLLLGKIIDKLAGEPFDQFIARRQFHVAHMPSTGFYDGTEVVPNGARIYTIYQTVNGRSVYSGKISNQVIEYFPHFIRTAAGINTTVNDLTRWLIALQSGQLLKHKSSIDQLWTPGTLNNGKPSAFSPFMNGYAVGWPTALRPKHRALAPTGGGRAAFLLYPDDDLTVVVMTNLAGASPENFIDQVAGIYLPDLRVSNGFGLPANVRRVQTVLRSQSVEYVADQVEARKLKMTEGDLINWAYNLLDEPGQMKAAIKAFKLGIRLFPKSANTHDSLGEAYEDDGFKRLAIVEYKRALARDPSWPHSLQRLKALMQGS